jgi:hypothetical protein
MKTYTHFLQQFHKIKWSKFPYLKFVIFYEKLNTFVQFSFRKLDTIMHLFQIFLQNFILPFFSGGHDTQHNDIHHNDIQHNNN